MSIYIYTHIYYIYVYQIYMYLIDYYPKYTSVFREKNNRKLLKISFIFKTKEQSIISQTKKRASVCFVLTLRYTWQLCCSCYISNSIAKVTSMSFTACWLSLQCDWTHLQYISLDRTLNIPYLIMTELEPLFCTD